MNKSAARQPDGESESLVVCPSIVIVDDDTEICDLLRRYFTEHGFRAHVAGDGTALGKILATTDVDLVVLDLMLPGDDGFTICRSLRSHSNIPIIMLTANNDETDRIVGLEIGADDYVEKPFNARELLARVKAVLRRHNARQEVSRERVRYRYFANWRLDCLKRNLEQDGAIISLGGPEYRLLEILLDHPNQIISRDELSIASRRREHIPYDRTIDIQISRLRQLLKDSGKEPALIRTIRGEGYMLLCEVRDEA